MDGRKSGEAHDTSVLIRAGDSACIGYRAHLQTGPYHGCSITRGALPPGRDRRLSGECADASRRRDQLDGRCDADAKLPTSGAYFNANLTAAPSLVTSVRRWNVTMAIPEGEWSFRRFRAYVMITDGLV